jgi:hypothetical protein
MRGTSGGLLIIVGLIALWLALTGKLEIFAEFWNKLVASGAGSADVITTGGQGKGGGTDWLESATQDESLADAIKKLPNPPKLPPGILNDPIFR